MRGRAGIRGAGRTGIWSWNPNLWGMTQDEALAYEQKKDAADLAATQTQAQIDLANAQTAAQVDAINPSVTTAVSKAVQSTVETSATLYNILILLGVGAVAFIAYDTYQTSKAKRGR